MGRPPRTNSTSDTPAGEVTNVAPPPLPSRRASGAELPAASPPPPPPPAAPGGVGPVPAGDPFHEPSEPKLPRGGAPEEKLEWFRQRVKLKDETLQRARSMYAETAAEL